MASFIIRLFSNSVALWVAYLLVPGLIVNRGVTGFVLAGLVLGLLNLTVKPILKFVSAPIIILTLGIFSLIINGFLLWLVSYFLDFVVIQTSSALIWSTIIISFVNVIITTASKALTNQND
ncbi:MAG TPA: phage holin family protein [Candidatus Paceibacterota bacterium]